MTFEEFSRGMWDCALIERRIEVNNEKIKTIQMQKERFSDLTNTEYEKLGYCVGVNSVLSECIGGDKAGLTREGLEIRVEDVVEELNQFERRLTPFLDNGESEEHGRLQGVLDTLQELLEDVEYMEKEYQKSLYRHDSNTVCNYDFTYVGKGRIDSIQEFQKSTGISLKQLLKDLNVTTMYDHSGNLCDLFKENGVEVEEECLFYSNDDVKNNIDLREIQDKSQEGDGESIDLSKIKGYMLVSQETPEWLKQQNYDIISTEEDLNIVKEGVSGSSRCLEASRVPSIFDFMSSSNLVYKNDHLHHELPQYEQGVEVGKHTKKICRKYLQSRQNYIFQLKQREKVSKPDSELSRYEKGYNHGLCHALKEVSRLLNKDIENGDFERIGLLTTMDNYELLRRGLKK